MLLTATLLGLIAALGILDGRLLGVSMIDRPLVMCALTGLVCGNLHEGILIGATLELIFLGNVAIGAAVPPDVVTGSVLATAFSIMSGRGPEAALTIAIPISMLAQTLGVLVRVVNARFGHMAIVMRRRVIPGWWPLCTWEAQRCSISKRFSAGLFRHSARFCRRHPGSLTPFPPLSLMAWLSPVKFCRRWVSRY
ncbi:PTS family sugar transport protein component IIC [Salmonella enterica subsp. salamae]|uniref:PTS family sugar transport protein component IIC n=1 Tax=Salmonella enterica subsp. salamae TaxID=59202 RepID=A0A6D2GE47_SALER|nr:PTS family sugar transport protein component IIC [Salmonella enterica subsp. salamae]